MEYDLGAMMLCEVFAFYAQAAAGKRAFLVAGNFCQLTVFDIVNHGACIRAVLGTCA
ncbi:MAG: hypothetical protein ABJQ70_13770 [Roseobacter sp.]